MFTYSDFISIYDAAALGNVSRSVLGHPLDDVRSVRNTWANYLYRSSALESLGHPLDNERSVRSTWAYCLWRCPAIETQQHERCRCGKASKRRSYPIKITDSTPISLDLGWGAAAGGTSVKEVIFRSDFFFFSYIYTHKHIPSPCDPGWHVHVGSQCYSPAVSCRHLSRRI